jgi:hypothetical protein
MDIVLHSSIGGHGSPLGILLVDKRQGQLVKVFGWMYWRQPSPLLPACVGIKDHSEPAPTSAPQRMNGKWSGNSFLSGSGSLANHDG